MKNLRNLFVFALFALLVLIVPTGTAYAANVEEYHSVDVCVNNEWVDASVYVDTKNVAWVANYSQLYIIFPDETSHLNFPAAEEPSSLKNWATRFDYTLKVTPNAVYLSKEDTIITTPENIKLYVNNIRVNDVTVYLENDVVWLGSYSDVFKVFPEETKNMYIPTVNAPTELKSWANEFNYKMVVNDWGVYLNKEIPAPENPNVPGTTTPGNPNTPVITIPENVKLYVNGLLISDVSATLDKNGKSFVSSYSDLRKVFPNETKHLSFPTVMGSVELKPWANSFGYTYVQKGYRIYLSNTGVTPIEIYLNSAIINFPDQQPIILNNRTMIPIRAVSESLGWNVSWGENVVTITNNSHTLILYIGKNYYTIDSVKKTLDVPAQIMNNRTMVPIRFVAEAFGYNVGYDGSESVKVVTISK